ncbi:MAG: YeeE/YedE family protein [Luminiphilus sp.]|nr:YeeE/YedE family protein [Luminiphilus sp.]
MRGITGLLTGLLFGAGLALSGMTDTAKVIGFLNVFGGWDPDLMWVMSGALVVTLIGTPLVLSKTKPMFDAAFSLPLATTVDGRLVAGAVLFGMGWGLWGYCPGPAVAALAYGDISTVVFCIAMLVGMWLAGKSGLTISRLQQ